MHEQSVNITITTECPRGRAQLRVLRFIFWGIAFGLLCVVPFIWIVPFEDTPRDIRVDLTCLLVICSIAAMVPPLSTERGIWTFTSTRVCFVSLNGSERSLRWDEVERVQWHRTAAAFHAGKTSIQINWNMNDVHIASNAKLFVEKKLSPLFDLTPYGRPALFRPGIWPALLWGARMFAISIPLTAMCIGGPLVAAIWFPCAGWAWAVGMTVLFSPWLLVIPVAIQERRKYPLWRKLRSDSY